jgi:hypothetical protein
MSTIESLRNPKEHSPVFENPSSSGPRWVMVAAMDRMVVLRV